MRGEIRIIQTDDGRLAIVNTLPFPQYLQGLAEVPRSWPRAALDAQVIAARSYALYHLAHPRPAGRSLGYDICATDACQVYRGAAVEHGAFGERWVAAVQSTRGRILTHDGAPIQAFYHSTSTGRTQPNFPRGTPLPYLSSVSGEDADSPLARWSTHIPFGDLSAILSRAGAWPGGPVGRVTASSGEVVVSNTQRRVSIPAARFRRILNIEAPCAFPKRYPPQRADGGRLPSTVPHARYTIAAEPGGIAVFGRGWGHDVGMSQYGARSLAARGRSAADILAHFYNGLRPSFVNEPSKIRVLIAEGAAGLVIVPEKTGDIAGTAVTHGNAFQITPAADGPRVARIPVPAPTPLEIENRGTTTAPGIVRQKIFLANPARIRLGVNGSQGKGLAMAETPYERGLHTISIFEPGGPPFPAGRYDMTIQGYDGLDRGTLRTRFEFVPASAATTAAQPAPAPPPSRRSPWPVAAAIALAMLLGGVLFGATRHRIQRRP